MAYPNVEHVHLYAAGYVPVYADTAGRWGSTHALGPTPSCRGGRRRSGGGARRRQERRPERSREARPAERQRSRVLDAGKVSFGPYADDWLKHRKLEDRTRERNESVIRVHIKPTFGAGSLAAITTPRVRAWRTALLEDGVGEPTVVKAYQLLRAILNTAVDDELIRRNPCRIKGADRYDVPERPVLTVAEVYAVADAIRPHHRALVLLAAFTTLRFGELASLRRRDLDLTRSVVLVRRAQSELQNGTLADKAPKSAAGVRPVAFPAELVPELAHHLEHFAGAGQDGISSGVPAAACFGVPTSGTTGPPPARRPASPGTCTSTTSGTPGTPWRPAPGPAHGSS